MGEVKKVLKFYLYIDSLKIKLVIFGVFYMLFILVTNYVQKFSIMEYINNPDISLDSAINYTLVFMFITFFWIIMLIDYYRNKYTDIFQCLPIRKDIILKTNFLVICFFAATRLIDIISIFRLNIVSESNYYVTAVIGFTIALFCLWIILISFCMGFGSFRFTKGKAIGHEYIIFLLSAIVINLFIKGLNMNFGSNKPMGEPNALGKVLTDIIKSFSVLGGFWGIVTIVGSILLGVNVK